MADGLPRMNLNQRVQHGLLILTVGGALASGLVLGRPLGVGASSLRFWHFFAGFGAIALLGYHLLYLAIRGYVEARGWSGFPLRWSGGDLEAALAGGRFVLFGGAAPPEPDEYRPSQKALYWWSLVALALLGATGGVVGFWGRFGSLSLLPQFAALHRGCALLVLVSILWHLYGVLTWGGGWWPEWSWITGALAAEKASVKVPGAWRRYLGEESARADTGAEATPEEKARERQSQEKAQVEEELEKGNRFALEERYVESLYHYRRALELYPDYSQARYNMARVLTRMGEREMAREAYEQFLVGDPFHPLARKAQEAIRELDARDGQS
ncbi:MAG: cytochrome b/b6 domain-containing protein [Candidatus Methylomirabilia bacterium]